jgi:hypothetical protein
VDWHALSASDGADSLEAELGRGALRGPTKSPNEAPSALAPEAVQRSTSHVDSRKGSRAGPDWRARKLPTAMTDANGGFAAASHL